MKYNGPKEKLEAAKSSATNSEDLAELSQSEYNFVQAAVAANPNTPVDSLEKLVPSGLSDFDCQIILGLLSNQNLPPELVLRISILIQSSAQDIFPRNHYQNEIVKKMAGCPNAPLASILPLANPLLFPRHLRSRIANTDTRSELLHILSDDPSEKIAKMAAKALKSKYATGGLCKIDNADGD